MTDERNFDDVLDDIHYNLCTWDTDKAADNEPVIVDPIGTASTEAQGPACFQYELFPSSEPNTGNISDLATDFDAARNSARNIWGPRGDTLTNADTKPDDSHDAQEWYDYNVSHGQQWPSYSSSGNEAHAARHRLLELYAVRTCRELVDIVVCGNLIPSWAALEVMQSKRDYEDFTEAIAVHLELYNMCKAQIAFASNIYQLACCGCEWIQWLAFVHLEAVEWISTNPSPHLETMFKTLDNVDKAMGYRMTAAGLITACIKTSVSLSKTTKDTIAEIETVSKMAPRNPTEYYNPLLNFEFKRLSSDAHEFDNYDTGYGGNIWHLKQSNVYTMAFKQMATTSINRGLLLLFARTSLTWPLLGDFDDSVSLLCYSMDLYSTLVSLDVAFIPDSDLRYMHRVETDHSVTRDFNTDI